MLSMARFTVSLHSPSPGSDMVDIGVGVAEVEDIVALALVVLR